MTHLRIEQNNGVIEEVSSEVIEKLYNIVHDGTLDNTSNLVGRLHTDITYADYVDYLENYFKVNGVKLLIINADGRYIRFIDPVVKNYWANSAYGDGTGITIESASLITQIPTLAFKSNTSITSFNELNLFINCTTIGSEAFCNCTNLTSINLSNITTLYGYYDINGCTGLTGVLNLPKFTGFGTNKNSARNSLSLCGFTEVNIGANVQDSNKITWIALNTFNSCYLLTKVTGLSKVTEIVSGAFNECTSLRELDLSSELTTLQGNVFSECSNLECIDITNVTNIIGEELFKYDWKLVDLATNDINNINRGAATYTFNWNSITTNMFAGCILTNKSFILPNATIIKKNAFNSTGIISITIPNVTELELGAFASCSNLTTVNSSNNLSTIGSVAFENCSSLLSIDSSGVLSLGSSCFKGCTSLLCIDITNVSTIEGEEIFRNCSNLVDLSTNDVNNVNTGAATYTFGWNNITHRLFTSSALTNKSFVFPNATTIGILSFAYSNVVSVNAPNVTSIGVQAFNECSSLLKVVLGNVITFNELAFLDCSNLEDVELYGATELYNSSTGYIDTTFSSVTKIDRMAFKRCSKLFSNLKTVNSNTGYLKLIFPNCTLLGEDAFHTSGIRAASFPAVTTFTTGWLFKNCTNLEYIDLPSITSIPLQFFYLDTNLHSFIIPNTVTSIGNEAFRYSGIQGVVRIPASVMSIGLDVWRNCNGITAFIFEGTTPPALANTFSVYVLDTLNPGIPIYVPDAALSDYQAVFAPYDNVSTAYLNRLHPMSDYTGS